MFFKKKSADTQKSPRERGAFSAGSSPASGAPASDSADRKSITVDHPDGLEDAGYGKPGTADGNWIVLGPNESRRSIAALPVSEGEVFELSLTAKLVDSNAPSPANGFFCGPVFYDADDQIVAYWSEQPAFEANEGQRRIVVKSAAPAGSVSVRIGLHGSWSAENAAADFTVAFTDCALTSL